jgi:hypothetical protein
VPPGAGWLALGALALAGCGAKPSAADGATPEAGALAERLSFDVTASFHPGPPSEPFGILPPSSTFSLTVDTQRRLIIAGAKAVSATTTDGRRFKVLALELPGPNQGCSGLQALAFASLEVTVTEATLLGTATGTARFVQGAMESTTSFTAELTGTPDVTPPFLVGSTSVTAFDPFLPVAVRASEPLPSGAKARLVGADGSSFDMVPTVSDGVVPVVNGFAKPDVTLTPGASYTVEADGLVDFAGNPGDGSPLRIGTVAPAPLAPQDGFESVTSATFGGAGVVRSGDLVPISGAESLYVGGVGTPGHDLYMQGPELLVRLAMPPGAQKLRFTFRTVVAADARTFDGSVRVGSAGTKPTDGNVTFQAPPDSTTSLWSNGSRVTVGSDQAMTLSLPPDAHDEVVVGIATRTIDCGSDPAVGMVVDDLRLE